MEQVMIFLHNLATATWIGGIIFLTLLGGEIEKLGPNFHIVMGKMTKRFSQLAMVSIVILIITGFFLTSWHGGIARVQRDLILNLKHLTVFLVIINGAYLSTRVVPNLEKLSAKKSPKTKIWQKKLKIGSLINLTLGIIIVFLATL